MIAERTFRANSLAELETRIRAELGPDAVIVRQREGLTGGIGGFFQRRLYEVDARPGDGVVAPPASALAAAAPAAAAEAPAAPAAGPASALIAEAEAAGVTFRSHLDAAGPAAAAAATDFIPDAFPRVGTPAAAATVVAPAPARSDDGAALAAMFAPDAPRTEPDWAAVEWFAPGSAPAPAPSAAPAPVAAASSTALAWPGEAQPVHGALLARGVSPRLAGELLDETVTHLLPFSSPASLKPLVAGALARRIAVQPLRGTGGRVVGFVGPGGSGKTRCIARLAHAYALRSSLPVACVALRPEDGGAELQRLLSPFGVPVHTVGDGREARERVSRLRVEGLVLVDTPGVSPRAEAELRVLAAELRQLRLDECHLALPATVGGDFARELVDGTRSLGVDAVALTHADETDRLGTVVECAIDAALPLSYVGRGTIITGGLRPVVADELATALTA